MKSANYFFVVFCMGIFSFLIRNTHGDSSCAREKGGEIVPPNGIINTESFVREKGGEIVPPNGIFNTESFVREKGGEIVPPNGIFMDIHSLIMLS